MSNKIPVDNLRKLQASIVGDSRYLEASAWLSELLQTISSGNRIALSQVLPGNMGDHFRNACLLVLVDHVIQGTAAGMVCAEDTDRVRVKIAELDEVGGAQLTVEAVGPDPNAATELYLVLKKAN